MEWDCSLFNPQFWCSCWSLVLLHCSRFPVNKRPCWVAKFFPVRKSNPGLVDESHKSSPLDQLGVFTYQSLTLVRILVVCSVTLNRFQCNESQCLTPKSPSPGVEPGTWGWVPQILVYFVNWHCSPAKYFPVRELNPGLVGERHKSLPLDQLGLGLYTLQSSILMLILVACSVALQSISS